MDWERRARELCEFTRVDALGEERWLTPEGAIQLGREMALEEADLARNDESTKWIKHIYEVLEPNQKRAIEACERKAADARGKYCYTQEDMRRETAKIDGLAAIAADARAEEIAVECEKQACSEGVRGLRNAWFDAVAIARSTIKKPKTREQLLEDALRKIRDECALGSYGRKIAENALEWWNARPR